MRRLRSSAIAAVLILATVPAAAQEAAPQQPGAKPQETAPQPQQPQQPAAQPPQPAPPSQEGDRDAILYEKYRYEKDGFTTISYRVGHGRGRILKAILEGAAITLPGGGPPAVSVSPNPRARVLSAEGWALESEDLNLFMVSDHKENMPFVEKVLRTLDVPDPQVVIEARVVELRWDGSLQFGIEGDLAAGATAWINNADSGAFLREIRARFNPTEAITGGPFQGSVFRFSRQSSHQGTIGGLVEMFVQSGKAEILSNPRLIVESGEQAEMSAGEKIPYFETLLHPAGSTITTKLMPTGVTLKVRPHIVGASNISLDLTVDVTALLGYVTGPTIGGITATAPSFTSRTINTRLTVHDGDEVAMGGLKRKEKSRTRRGLPFLSEIPILGWIFGRYEETEVTQEILFFIRPVILQGARELPERIFEPK